MIKEYVDEDEVIQMPLDIDHFFGEHESRMGPKLLCVIIALFPLVPYIYYGLFNLIPLSIFLPLFLIYATRVIMITVGQEKKRLYFYRKQLHDEWSSVYDLLRIKRIHEDGLVEFLSGHISYFLVAYNGNDDNKIVHSKMCEKFIQSCVEDKDYNIFIVNITESFSFSQRYKNVKLFSDRETAKDFVDIIDHNSKLVSENSVMQKIIIQINGYKSDWKELKSSIDSAIHSEAAKAFKNVYRITSSEELDEIFSVDLDGVVVLEEVIKNKYCTGNYYGSKVLCYDDNEEYLNKTQVKVVPRKGAMYDNYRSDSFHVIYKKENINVNT